MSYWWFAGSKVLVCGIKLWPIAATELARLGQWNSVDVESARDFLEPRQRRMTKRGDESAVPPEGANINRDRGARAEGPTAHRHFKGVLPPAPVLP